MPPDFDQARYWTKRHASLAGDPRSVGNLSKSKEINLQSEFDLIRIVDCALDLLGPIGSALDLGCGYGRISGCFTGRRIRYLGVDVSPIAIERARQRDPAAGFEVGDLAFWTTEETFDVVVVLYVFVHFVDEAAWRTMVQRALSWTAPGGALLFADQFPIERDGKGPHYVNRPIADYHALLEPAGFSLDDGFQASLTADPNLSPNAGHFRLARRTT